MIIPEHGRSYIDSEIIGPVDRAVELAFEGRQFLELAGMEAGVDEYNKLVSAGWVRRFSWETIADEDIEIIADGSVLIESRDSARRLEIFNDMLLHLTADREMGFEEVSLATVGSTHLDRLSKTLFNMAQLVVDNPYVDENHEFAIPE